LATNNSRKPIALYIAVAFAVGVGLAALWTFAGFGGGNPAHQTPNLMPAEAPMKAEAAAEEAPPPPADYTLVSGEVLNLTAAELPNDRPVILGLSLAVASPNSDPLDAIIMHDSGRRLDVKAEIVGAAKQSAYLEVEPGWLSPGDYLIHLKTNELTHLPLRRYPIVVR